MAWKGVCSNNSYQRRLKSSTTNWLFPVVINLYGLFVAPFLRQSLLHSATCVPLGLFVAQLLLWYFQFTGVHFNPFKLCMQLHCLTSNPINSFEKYIIMLCWVIAFWWYIRTCGTEEGSRSFMGGVLSTEGFKWSRGVWQSSRGPSVFIVLHKP